MNTPLEPNRAKCDIQQRNSVWRSIGKWMFVVLGSLCMVFTAYVVISVVREISSIKTEMDAVLVDNQWEQFPLADLDDPEVILQLVEKIETVDDLRAVQQHLRDRKLRRASAQKKSPCLPIIVGGVVVIGAVGGGGYLYWLKRQSGKE